MEMDGEIFENLQSGSSIGCQRVSNSSHFSKLQQYSYFMFIEFIEVPFDITIRYHHSISPFDITIRYHRSISPFDITITLPKLSISMNAKRKYDA